MFANESTSPDIHLADNNLYTIRQMALTYSVTLRALRFYEDRKLLTPIRDGNARLYDLATRARLQLILKGKQLGFTLLEIREMIAACNEEPMPSFEMALAPDQVIAQISHLQRQRDDIERAITELKATHEKLADKLTSKLATQHNPAVSHGFESLAAGAN